MTSLSASKYLAETKQHIETGNNASVYSPVPLAVLDAHVNRFEITGEWLPLPSIPISNNPNGIPSITLNYLDGSVRYWVAPNRWALGIGETLWNQQTEYLYMPVAYDASRGAGARYELVNSIPLRTGVALQTSVAAAPTIHAILSYTYRRAWLLVSAHFRAGGAGRRASRCCAVGQALASEIWTPLHESHGKISEWIIRGTQIISQGCLWRASTTSGRKPAFSTMASRAANAHSGTVQKTREGIETKPEATGHALKHGSASVVVRDGSLPEATTEEAAKVLVEHLFAQNNITIPGISYAVGYKLAVGPTGGDIVDVYHYDNNCVAFAIADISAKDRTPPSTRRSSSLACAHIPPKG